LISLTLACIAGALLLGSGIQGFPQLLTRALGNESFIWICTIELCIGILVAFFQRSGAVRMFTIRAAKWARNRRQVSLLGWGMGLFIFFSDYFSPLFVGPVMRNLTDKYRISREKLAYICDSTSAPLVLLIPITGWAAYMSGLLIGTAGIESKEAAIGIFMKSIPFNFYSYLAVLLVAVLALALVRDFGPMAEAERRAQRTGKVLRDGASPMMGRELTELEATRSGRPNLFLNFLLPVLLIITTNVATFLMTGSATILESFMLAVAVLGLIMWLQRIDDLSGMMTTALAGIKGVMPAVIILALAYCINTISKDLKTAEFIVAISREWLSPGLLPALAFVISAVISFSTGTAWGTYAIMVPIAVPLAYHFSGQELGTLVYCSFAAVAGGGVFGDHCSPLSDTTVLSSLGSACDHIDHVRTQLPYALLVAGISVICYLLVGFGVRP
jgi:Na+/H+ antiporter NhaC